MLEKRHQIYYTGEFLAGKYHGYGHKLGEFAPAPFSYKGYYEEGKAHGKGELIMHENYYIGNLQRGQRKGYGCDLIANSSAFLGPFKDDRRHGY